MVWHHVDTVPLTPVELIESFITAPVRIVLDTEAINFRILPVACELFAIRPLVGAKAFNDSVNVVSGISLIIGPFLNTVSIALAIAVEADEAHAIWVAFLTEAVLDILLEHAFVDEEIHMSRNSLSMLHVVGPLAFVGFSLHVSELAVAMSSPQIPSALITGSISEFHSATAVTESIQPLSIVAGP